MGTAPLRAADIYLLNYSRCLTDPMWQPAYHNGFASPPSLHQRADIDYGLGLFQVNPQPYEAILILLRMVHLFVVFQDRLSQFLLL